MDAIPENFGRRLFASLVEHRAKNGHQRPFALVTNTSNPADGFHEFHWSDLNRVAKACAWIVDEAMGKPKPYEFPTFGWMGPSSDFRYFAMLLAAMKTRRKAFFPSPRNSLVAHLSLLDQCECHTFFVPAESPPAVIDEIAKKRHLKIVLVPTIEEMLISKPKPYCFKGTFDDCWLDPICVLHTSGSTGVPKAITVKHHFFTSVDATNKLPYMGREPYNLALNNIETFCPMPLFHAGGLFCSLAFPTYFDQTLIAMPQTPLTSDNVNEIWRHRAPNYALLPATIIKELVEETAFHENLSKVQYLSWVGSGLTTKAAEAINKFVTPLNLFGMTEMAAAPCGKTALEDFSYHKFLDVLGAEFRHVQSDQYELVIVRNPEFKLFQVVFSTFPHLNEWGTKDLWTPHPTKPGLWKYFGRKDDIIIFDNGEKLNPLTIETHIGSHPLVAGCLVVGEGRFQAGLLVETTSPLDSREARKEAFREIWPTIEQVNIEAVAHGRIAREFVIFAKPEKPFSRAGKGTIQRKISLELYKDEINAMYAKITGPSLNDSYDIDGDDRRMTEHDLQNVVALALGKPSLSAEEDLFSIGLDSLQASNLARQVGSHLRRSDLTLRTIYKHPTIRKLATFLKIDSNQITKKKPSKTRIEKMQDQFDVLTKDLPITARAPIWPQAILRKSCVVVLTGSTGSLGSYILHSLVQKPQVKAIYCINRSLNAIHRQTDINSRRGLSTDFQKVHFYHSDALECSYLGLSIDKYMTLAQEATHVLHNAWPVNFNMTLDSFEPSLRGVRRLIDFSTHSAHGASLHFVSSIGTVQGWPEVCHHYGRNERKQVVDVTADGLPNVPEQILADWNLGLPSGYAESKLVAENVLAEAAYVSSVPSTVYRVGQIAGPVLRDKGQWNQQEWLPSLVASSKYLGAVPADLGKFDRCIDWIPVDILGEVFADLLLGDDGRAENVKVRHLVNPRTTTWSSIFPTILEAFLKEAWLGVLPFEQWVQKLRESVNNEEFGLGTTVNGYKSSVMIGGDHHKLNGTDRQEFKDSQPSCNGDTSKMTNGDWVHSVNGDMPADSNGTACDQVDGETSHVPNGKSPKNGETTQRDYSSVSANGIQAPTTNGDTRFSDAEQKTKVNGFNGVNGHKASQKHLAHHLTQNPAAKILPFFEDLVVVAEDGAASAARLDTVETRKHSETMRQMHAVTRDWMGKWMKQWGFA